MRVINILALLWAGAAAYGLSFGSAMSIGLGCGVFLLGIGLAAIRLRMVVVSVRQRHRAAGRGEPSSGWKRASWIGVPLVFGVVLLLARTDVLFAARVRVADPGLRALIAAWDERSVEWRPTVCGITVLQATRFGQSVALAVRRSPDVEMGLLFSPDGPPAFRPDWVRDELLRHIYGPWWAYLWRDEP